MHTSLGSGPFLKSVELPTVVEQLQTQITDLEMFIEFLQNEASTIVPADCNGCG